MLPSTYDLLSSPAQALLRATLAPADSSKTIANSDQTIGQIVEQSALDQVDVVMILLRSGDAYMRDVERLVGHPVTGRIPSLDPLAPSFAPDDDIAEAITSTEDQATWLDDWLARHPNRFDIDNWVVAPTLAPPLTRPEVAGALAHATMGITVQELHRRGLSYETIDLLQEIGLVTLHAPETATEAASVDNWWIASLPGAEPVHDKAQRALLTIVRAGRTVKQLIARGLSYDQLDDFQQRGWVRLLPPGALAAFSAFDAAANDIIPSMLHALGQF